MTQIDVSPVDWSRPIEDANGFDAKITMRPHEQPADWAGHYDVITSDGARTVDRMGFSGAERVVRNRQEPQSTDPKLVERALKLVRDMSGAGDVSAMTAEARQIIREIDGPQTDEEWASDLVSLSFVPQTEEVEALALTALRKGRELEREARH